ncbi:MAG: hypothetical protein AAGA56_09545 [Myxococcota bacterium]
MSASATWAGTRLSFGDGSDVDLRRQAVTVSLEYRATEELTLTAGVGAAIDGDITPDGAGTRYELDPGVLGVVGAAYRILQGEGWEPFLLVSGAASTVTGPSRLVRGNPADGITSSRYTGLDLRAGLTVGEVFLDHIAPYATVRGFGGPIFWRGLTGSDKFHYQVGAGLLVTTGVIDSGIELIPFGERSATFTLATSF